jgi:hypothetical protein
MTRFRPPADNGECIEEVAHLSRGDFDALVARLLACRSGSAVLQNQLLGRVAEVECWPAGRVCPLGRIREAWVAHRYGLARVAERGAADAGPVPAALVGRAIRLYETHRAARPPGWPEGGAAALCVLADQVRARSLAGDVARLLALAKGMRAVALEHDRDRLRRVQARAARRRRPASTRFAFRIAVARVETSEQRRRRVRDAVLLAGGDPAAWPNADLALRWLRLPAEPALIEPDRLEELDAYGARAASYRAQLASGAWRLPPDRHNPNEGARR